MQWHVTDRLVGMLQAQYILAAPLMRMSLGLNYAW